MEGLVTENVLLSTTDLSVHNIRVELRGPSKSCEAICSALPPGCPQRLLVTPRDDITIQDVVLSELLNQRGPAAWVAAPAGGDEHERADAADALSELAQRCNARGMVLVLTSALCTFDLVLVPRSAVAVDGVGFCLFATRVEGIRFMAQTIAAKKVAVVLDLDSTLLESEHLPVQPPEWRQLPWKALNLRQEPSGQAVTGRVSRLPDESHHAESVHAATWIWKGAVHSYRVRQRLGWSHLRDLLIQEGHQGGKLATYVLSLGRPLYIQTCWHILDPRGLIIAQHEFKQKVNSARPDGVYWVPEKTPCIGVGLRSVFDPDFNMRLGPLWIADDIPEVFMEKYRDAVFGVPAYKPVASLPSDYDADGSVLRGMSVSIMRFWEHCYGADGNGGAVGAAARAAQHVMHQLCDVPMAAGEAVGWFGRLFKGQEDISSALSVRSFLEKQQNADLQPAAVEDAVPAALFVPENDENALQPKAVAVEKAPAVVPLERALRPSSRQDNVGPAPPAAQHGKAGCSPQLPAPQQQAAPAAAAELPAAQVAKGQGQEQVETMAVEDACPAGHAEPAVAAASAVQCASTAGASSGASDSEQHSLVLPPASSSQAQGQGQAAGEELEAAVGGPLAVEVAEGDGAAVVVEVEVQGCSCLDDCPVELAGVAASTDVEDEEVVALPAEGMDESGLPGRKRQWTDIADHETVLGPAAPVTLAATG